MPLCVLCAPNHPGYNVSGNLALIVQAAGNRLWNWPLERYTTFTIKTKNPGTTRQLWSRDDGLQAPMWTNDVFDVYTFTTCIK